MPDCNFVVSNIVPQNTQSVMMKYLVLSTYWYCMNTRDICLYAVCSRAFLQNITQERFLYHVALECVVELYDYFVRFYGMNTILLVLVYF